MFLQHFRTLDIGVFTRRHNTHTHDKKNTHTRSWRAHRRAHHHSPIIMGIEHMVHLSSFRNVRSHQNRIYIEVKWPQNGALQFKRAQWLNWLIPCMRQLWMDSFKCHHTVRKFKSFARFWCVYFSIVMCSYRGECTHLSTKHSPFSLHE